MMAREIVTSENKAEHDAKKLGLEDSWYHGSLGELKGKLRLGKGTLGEGFYLTTDKNKAALYPKLHAKLQKIENPDVRVTKMKHNAKNTYELFDLPTSKVDVNKLKEAGYDSIRYRHELNVFDPENVIIHKEV